MRYKISGLIFILFYLREKKKHSGFTLVSAPPPREPHRLLFILVHAG